MAWISRSFTYRNQGSFFFSKAERESYALLFDVEILSLVRAPYETLKSVPAISFYGRATIFHGASVFAVLDQKFVRQRFLSLRNERVAQAFDDRLAAINANVFGDNLGEAIENFSFSLTAGNRAPLLEHRPTIVKFKATKLSQFRFTCYHLPFTENALLSPEFDDPDPTSDADQYPAPRINTAENPFLGLPEQSPIPAALDPRDFEEFPTDPGLLDGVLSYEFRRGDTGLFDNAVPKNVKYPGQIVEGTAPGFANVISWRDDEGTETVMVQQNAGSVAECRFVQFTAQDGRIFVPDPNSFIVGP